MSTVQNKPYQSALLFTGGGLHSGYYLGLYQALCEHGKRPDVVIASCGGSLVASLIACTPNSDTACELFMSRDYYEMITKLQPTKPKHPLQHMLPAFRRYLNFNKNKPKTHISQKDIDELTTLALADMDINALNEFFHHKNNSQTPVIITASRLSYHHNSPDKWQSLLWSSQKTLTQKLLTLNPINPLAKYNPNTIDKKVYITDSLPISVMVRASIADMYYLAPITYALSDENLVLAGGVLDLTPIELAQALATTIYAETKADYDTRLAEPAIYQVFGFLANERLNDVRHIMQNSPNIHTVHTANYRQHIAPFIGKRFHWHGGLFASYPNFNDYQRIAKAQIEYGYGQMMKLING